MTDDNMLTFDLPAVRVHMRIFHGHSLYGDYCTEVLCCPARGLRADRRDKLLKWRDTGGHNCTPNNRLLRRGTEPVRRSTPD